MILESVLDELDTECCRTVVSGRKVVGVIGLLVKIRTLQNENTRKLDKGMPGQYR